MPTLDLSSSSLRERRNRHFSSLLGAQVWYISYVAPFWLVHPLLVDREGIARVPHCAGVGAVREVLHGRKVKKVLI